MNTICLDAAGVRIQGKPTVLLASSFFYFRIPREKWAARMELLKLAGYNTIDVYFPWNYHTHSPGEWDFAGQRDVRDFLELAAEKGLYVIARPGPYICSEWDGGAIPAWLYARGIPVRQDDPRFLTELFAWYAQILPLLAEFQLHRQGSVILLQIENELDFFVCESPTTYMDKLRVRAREQGIEIPLFYCCGQNDMSRAGGPLEDACVSFNIYSDDNDPHMEERTLHLRGLAQSRGNPLLVSETNRIHGYLKRLLACGAKLLSPYNQTGGTDFEYYQGVTNWGPLDHPMSYMTTNYDFGSMITSAGGIRPEFYQARLLASFLETFGEALGAAVPVANSRVQVDPTLGMTAHVPVLEMGGEAFFPLSNLTGETLSTDVVVDGRSLRITLPPVYTALLPVEVDLARFGGEGRLLGCGYEIAWHEGNTLVLYGQGDFEAYLERDGRVEKISSPVDGVTELEAAGLTLRLMGLKDAARLANPYLPAMPQALEAEPATTTINTLPGCGFSFVQGAPKEAPVTFMEELGQYRGLAAYEVEVPGEGDLLLQDAADLLEITREGEYQGYRYSPGCTLRIPGKPGAYRFTTEIWGHSNFDDQRLPALRMGSMKGLGKLTQIRKEQDLSANWHFRLEDLNYEKDPDCHYEENGTIMSIDAYNRGLAPMSCAYSKLVRLPEGCDSYLLHFSKAECMIKVYVNGRLVRHVCGAEPYVDISSQVEPGALVDITLHTFRHYHSELVGQVTLISGNRIPRCQYAQVDFPAQGEGPAEAVSLPRSLKNGERRMLTLTVPDIGRNDLQLVCKGKNAKLTFIRGGKVVGRILLENPELPAMRGGDPAILYLPGEWLEGGQEIQIFCQAIGEGAVLEPLLAQRFPWIFEV